MRSLLVLFLFSAPAFAADVPEIRLPKIEQSKPDPTPKPVTKLGKGHWYVIDSDLPLLVLASPQGLVSTHKDAGPIRLRGLFADGKGEIETREYKGKEVWSIEAEKSGRVELLIVKTGTVDPAEVIRVTLDVDAGEGPRPPPDDGKDDVKPDPKPEPKPTPKAQSLYLAVIREPMGLSVDHSVLLGDTQFWDGFKQQGHEWDIWTTTSMRARELNYLSQVEGVQLPALLVLDKDTGRKLTAVTLPTDKAGVTKIVQEASK